MLRTYEIINNIDIKRLKIPLIESLLNKNKKTIEDQCKPMLDFLQKVINKGKKIHVTLWQTASQLIDTGIKHVNLGSLTHMIDPKVTALRQSIRELTNLPTQKDIEDLVRLIDALDAKVQALLSED